MIDIEDTCDERVCDKYEYVISNVDSHKLRANIATHLP
jgi:hypothetical protein